MGSTSEVKTRLIACCDELAEIVRENAVEYDGDILGKLEALKSEVVDHVFKIFLVGPFSCGKSSLLNRWIGSEVLTTGLKPETAVSSELHYAEQERMVLQPMDPREPELVLKGVSEANMIRVRDMANKKALANVVLYLNNAKLKEYKDICLVDLPGLDSANEAHEAALVRFIQDPNRVAVVCAPMNDGTIQASVLEFLDKIHPSDPAILLTKADERPESEHLEIENVVRSHLRQHGWCDSYIGKASRDSVEEFEHLIHRYQTEKNEFFASWFGSRLRELVEDILSPLRRALAANYDNSQVDDALAKIKETERHLPEIIATMQGDLMISAQSAVEEVMGKVRESLMSQRNNLMQRTESGLDCMAEVASLIRSTLADAAPLAIADTVQSMGEKAGRELDQNLDFDLNFPSEEENAVEVLSPAESGRTPKPESSAKSLGGSIVSGITVLESAYTLGNLFMPGAGGAIGLVVASAAMFFTSRDANEERSRKETEFTMRLEDVCKGARPKVERAMMSAVEQCGRKLQVAMEGKVKGLHDQMTQLKHDSALKKAEWDARQAVRRSAIARVEAAMAKVGI